MSKVYCQKFREIWTKDPLLKDWLISIESTSGKMPKCKFCKCLLANKYSDLKNHMATKKHKSNAEIIIGKKQTKLPFVPEHHLDGAKVAEAKLALYIACHSAILNTDHLVPICKTSFKGKEAEYLQMHRTKCSQIIKNVFAPYFINELCEDVANGPFSILIDESNDISFTKYLGISIIYFSVKHKKMINAGLGLGELESGNAVGIVQCILNMLKTYKLNIKHLHGLGTDNASVMTGINNGVHKKLLEYNPNIILIRCLCHSLQLATSAATKELPRNLEFLVRETYDWFSKSSLRQCQYKELYKTINDGAEPLKIVQACATRWLSIEPAISRIYAQWVELKSHFQIAKLSNEKCYTADLLHQMYSDEFNFAYICFLKPILADVNKVNKTFESNNADPTKLLNDLMNLLESLIQKVVTPNTGFDLFKHKIEDYVDYKCYLGYLFENQLKIMVSKGFKDEDSLRKRCITFLIILIKEISNRVPDNVQILKKMSNFSVQKCLRHNKIDIIDLLKFINKSDVEISVIENQWKKIHLIEWSNINDTHKFWLEVLDYKDSENTPVFKELALVAIGFLSLPYSNAEIERQFSQMNVVKNKLRNRMKLLMLNSILVIRNGLRKSNICCKDFVIPHQIVKKIKSNECYFSNNNEDDEDNDFELPDINL